MKWIFPFLIQYNKFASAKLWLPRSQPTDIHSNVYSIFLRSVAIGVGIESEFECDECSSIGDCGELGWTKRIVVKPFAFRINL